MPRGGVVDVQADAIRFGRTTYEMMRSYWPAVDDPDDKVAEALNNRPKFVVSTTLDASEADWGDTTVISHDVLDRVRELKARPGREPQVHGSRVLARTLQAAGLVDELRLIIFPTAIGDGKGLFDGPSAPSGFEVVSSAVTGKGAVALTLRPRPFETGGFAVVDGKEQKI